MWTLEQKKILARIKRVNYIMIRGSIHHEARIILSVYSPNKSFKIFEAKTDRMEKINRQIHK